MWPFTRKRVKIVVLDENPFATGVWTCEVRDVLTNKLLYGPASMFSCQLEAKRRGWKINKEV